VKATSLGPQGILRPGLSTKKDECPFLEINRVKVLSMLSRQASGDPLCTEAGRLEGAGPI
jgi:hypothetical protein